MVSMRTFNRMVRKAVMHSQRAKIRMDVGLTGSTDKVVSLILADDDPDYEITSDGTAVAECETLSRIEKIDLNLSYFAGTSNAAGGLVEWALYRDPDNSGIMTGPEDIFIATDSAGQSQRNKNVIAYGGFYSSANNDTKLFHVRIRRAALRRVARMNDNDRLKFIIVTPATGAKFFMYGAITWMK